MNNPVNDNMGKPHHGPAVLSLADARAHDDLRASLKKMIRELARAHAWADHVASTTDSET
ncbi:hypothetical protein GCM10011273_17230 [Asticcacaulis endophyticus]|uniref:Uncharacterized protein n=1 Tax=Asticcacaulis endophyticus TaxID=1395890 RepID=A0A918Q5V3_9CAUL|nr:hypothetical protein GCM10011273_17230 [Asticcacaulis endophyticus]